MKLFPESSYYFCNNCMVCFFRNDYCYHPKRTRTPYLFCDDNL